MPPAEMRVFLAEDEGMVATILEAMLRRLGCSVVAVANRLENGVTLAKAVVADAAILDVNLAGEMSYPIAEILQDRGIPFLFLTGYGVAGRPDTLSHVPVLSKPFRRSDLATALEGIILGSGG